LKCDGRAYQILPPRANQWPLLARLKTTFGAIFAAVVVLAILAAALILGWLIAVAIAIAIAFALAVGGVRVALQRRR
jgi:hypothetical protein